MTRIVTENILIVDNDKQLLRPLLEAAARHSIRAVVATTRKSAKEYLHRSTWRVVLIGQDFTDSTGRECYEAIYEQIRASHPELPVVLTSPRNDAATARKAIQNGYADFLVKPPQTNEVERLLERFVPQHHADCLAQGQQNSGYEFRIIGRSKALKNTVELARRMAPTAAPVLITGESGTGKELVAHLIHQHSHRAAGPFIRVNCAALSDSLLESELFGHEKGAFTGALQHRQGRFERAHGGTLLLDEITETHPRFQAQLLRVLEEMDFERVGGHESISVNVRILATTNKDILQEVTEKRFREDLYYRISALRLSVPSLRERLEDLEDLTWHFINQFAPETNRSITAIDAQLLNRFACCDWPGNIRQLRNVIRTAVILGSGPVLQWPDIAVWHQELQSSGTSDMDEVLSLAGMNLQQLEQQAILATLKQTDGNQMQAAKVLGISDRTLRDKIKRYKEQDRFLLTG